MTTMMTERNLMGMPGMGMTGASATTPAAPNMMMVPRCKMTFEKCNGGMKMTCVCEDQTSGRNAPESVHDDGGRNVQLLHDDERNDGLLLQHDDGHVQV